MTFNGAQAPSYTYKNLPLIMKLNINSTNHQWLYKYSSLPGYPKAAEEDSTQNWFCQWRPFNIWLNKYHIKFSLSVFKYLFYNNII